MAEKARRIETLIENYINGNITTAKQQAKGFSQHRLCEVLIECGFTEHKARTTAAFLKGQATFQEACDAE